MPKALAYLFLLLGFIALQITIYFSIVALIVFSVSVLVFGMNKIMAIILVLLYLIVSPATIILYRSDKLMAIKMRFRPVS
jgi:hypothetical protein